MQIERLHLHTARQNLYAAHTCIVFIYRGNVQDAEMVTRQEPWIETEERKPQLGI